MRGGRSESKAATYTSRGDRCGWRTHVQASATMPGMITAYHTRAHTGARCVRSGFAVGDAESAADSGLAPARRLQQGKSGDAGGGAQARGGRGGEKEEKERKGGGDHTRRRAAATASEQRTPRRCRSASGRRCEREKQAPHRHDPRFPQSSNQGPGRWQEINHVTRLNAMAICTTMAGGDASGTLTPA